VADAPWWAAAVFYQIYPRSWADSNGDGIGDLQGVISRLDYLAWLGVDGIWLNPIHPSPNDDWGYDVSDYLGVHPELGTMADVDELLRATARLNIKVLLDLVPNHSSNRHPWFVDAYSSRDSRHRDWYVWADARPGGGAPNNWMSVFAGEPAWEWHEPTQQYYLHNFLASQPDLNWWNEEVRDAFKDILAFWFDKGVAGFRIDVAHALVKDQELRDNPEATDKDPEQVRRIGQQQVYNMNRPEVHDVLRSWRRVCDAYPAPKLLVGETYVYEYEQLASFYGTGVDELNLAFNFPFIFAEFTAEALRDSVERTLAALPQHATPVWTGSNHDTSRLATRWCGGDDRKIRCALMMMLTLPGACFLYYGDEIGMTDVEVAFDDLQDPVGKRRWPEGAGRDPVRTPMQWTPAPGAGFTSAEVRPWLPVGDHRGRNVADQSGDPHSILSFCRALIQFRKSSPDLLYGGYTALPGPSGTWGWRRGASTTVIVNLGDETAETFGIEGTINLATVADRTGEEVTGAAVVGPWDGVVIEAATATSPPP